MNRYSQQFSNLNQVYKGLKMVTFIKKMSYSTGVAAAFVSLGVLGVILLDTLITLLMGIIAAAGVAVYLVYSFFCKLSSETELKIGNMMALCNAQSEAEFESIIAQSNLIAPLLYANDSMLLNFYDGTAISWDTIVFAEKDKKKEMTSNKRKRVGYGIKIKTSNGEINNALYPSMEVRDQIYDMIKERQIYFE